MIALRVLAFVFFVFLAIGAAGAGNYWVLSASVVIALLLLLSFAPTGKVG